MHFCGVWFGSAHFCWGQKKQGFRYHTTSRDVLGYLDGLPSHPFHMEPDLRDPVPSKGQWPKPGLPVKAGLDLGDMFLHLTRGSNVKQTINTKKSMGS